MLGKGPAAPFCGFLALTVLPSLLCVPITGGPTPSLSSQHQRAPWTWARIWDEIRYENDSLPCRDGFLASGPLTLCSHLMFFFLFIFVSFFALCLHRESGFPVLRRIVVLRAFLGCMPECSRTWGRDSCGSFSKGSAMDGFSVNLPAFPLLLFCSLFLSLFFFFFFFLLF